MRSASMTETRSEKRYATRARLGWLAPCALALVMGCGAPMTNQDGSTGSDAAIDAVTILGTYPVTTDVSAETALVALIGSIRSNASMRLFDAIPSELAPASAAGQLLTRLDQRFSGAAAAAGSDGLERRIRDALAAGRAATDDTQRSVAYQTIDKGMLTLLALAMLDQVEALNTAARADQWESVVRAWDRAAVFFTGLEDKFRSRSMSSVPNVWGAGVNSLTDENLADRTISFLVDGRNAANARARGGVIEISQRLRGYVGKYFYLSAISYANAIETAAMGTDVSVQRAEGRAFFEGFLLTTIDGAAPTAAVTAARMRWTQPGGASGMSRIGVISDAGQIAFDALGPPIMGYATATDDDRAGVRARIDGAISAFDEALAFASQDVARQRMRVVEAGALSQSGDHATATMRLADVHYAIQAVANLRMMR